MGQRVAKIHEHAISHVLGNKSAKPLDTLGDTLLIRRNHFSQVLRIHTARECCRADQVRKQNRDLAALRSVRRLRLRERRRGRSRRAFGNSFQEPHSVAERGDTEFLQISAVSFVKRAKSMSFSAKRCAYCPRPSFSSQSATCCIAAPALAIRMKLAT